MMKFFHPAISTFGSILEKVEKTTFNTPIPFAQIKHFSLLLAFVSTHTHSHTQKADITYFFV